MPPDLQTEMRGPRAVRHAITEFLRAEFPPHLAGCVAAWGLDPVAVVPPVDAPADPRTDGYFERQPEAIDRWPLVAVTTARAVSSGAKDFTLEGDPQFSVTYPVRVYSWVKAEGFDAAQDLRDDYATALRVTLLSHTHLGTNGFLTMVPSTVLTDFSAVSAVKGDRYVAGAYVGFNVTAVETLTDRLAMPGAQPRDTVSTVNPSASPLPAAPAQP